MKVFEETKIVDINNIKIKSGNVVRMLKSTYRDTISQEWQGIVLNDGTGDYNIYFGKWYGKDVLDPDSYGKTIQIDESDNHKLLIVGTIFDAVIKK